MILGVVARLKNGELLMAGVVGGDSSSLSSLSSLLHKISAHSTIQKAKSAIGTGQKLVAYTRACP